VYSAKARETRRLTTQSVQSIMGAMQNRRALATLENLGPVEVSATFGMSRSSGFSRGLVTFPGSEYDFGVPAGRHVVPMGTIIPRKRKDGTTGYTAQIVIKRGGKIVHRESQTFDRKQAATTWLGRREGELKSEGGLDRAMRPAVSLADVIDRYVAETLSDIGRTKAQVLRAIKAYDLANMDVAKIASSDVVAFARELAKDRKPQTVSNYLSHLQAVFAIARPAWGYALDPLVMKDAFAVARRLGFTGGSEKRDRRPTLDELDKLLTHFIGVETRRPGSIPMTVIIPFALFSTRRQEEITRITRADFEPEHSRVLVRDMKNPGQKIGNDVWCDLPDEAVALASAMPTPDAIFPYTTDAISAAFTRACKLLGIEDLHFHDLRHEGVSRLFEMGWNIPKVAGVSGHKSWSSLQRYSHIRQSGDKYAGWKWLAIAIERAKRIEA
jgi:integrase